MASRTHAPGQGQVLQQIGKAGLPAILASTAQQTQDLRNMVLVVGPAGFPGWVYVRNLCNDQIYKVQSLNGQSYAPGTMVLLGNQGGGFGAEFIIGAAPGQAGGSEVAVSTSVTFATFPVVPPPTPCLAVQLGHRYLGLLSGSSDGLVHAFSYNDGTIGADLANFAPLSFPGSQPGALAENDNCAERIHAAGNTVCYIGQILSPGDVLPLLATIVTWNIATNALFVLTTGVLPQFVGQLVWHRGTTDLYFVIFTPSGGNFSAQMNKVAIGSSGAMSGAAVGAPFIVASLDFHMVICGSTIGINGGRFAIGPNTWSAAPGDVSALNQAGDLTCASAWVLGAGSPTSVDGNSIVRYPLSPPPSDPAGNYFLRVTPPSVLYAPALTCPAVGTLVQPDGIQGAPFAFLCAD